MSLPVRPVAGPVSPLAGDHLTLRPLGIDQVRLTSGMWAKWQHNNRVVTTPHSFRWLERDGTIDNLRRLDPASGGAPERRGPWFTDSDLYKALEGVAWESGRQPSAELDALMKETTGIIAAALDADGYVNSFVQAGLDVRWDNLVKSHELYCIGHLIQAGIAHQRATGSDELLDVARRAADCVVRDFGDLRRGDTDGHEEIEMALVELYRQTGERKYLNLAQQFIDVRGHHARDPYDHFDAPYYQDATPVRDETVVVGHAVRAIYLLAGVVDLYLETGEKPLLNSALRQWDDMVLSKMYVNGAVGSRFEGEAFGDAFELPPDLVYGETCASIGNVMLGWRLLLATGESRFADVIERSLLNLVAASTSVDRTNFFYNNPAQRRIERPAAPTDARPARAEAPGTRPEWFECACCPPNIMRMIASLGAYVATHDGSGIQIHQYLPASVEVQLDGGPVRLEVSTTYPADGVVRVTVIESPQRGGWTLSMRQPGWCRDVAVQVNGQVVARETAENGYLSITRAWVDGDVVELVLAMPVRLTVAHPAADAVRGAVAIERGPIVYCLESPDQVDEVDLNHVELLTDRPIREELREDFLGEPTIVLTAEGLARDDGAWAGTAWRTLEDVRQSTGRTVELTAIPYHLWANRGPSTMRIFVPARSGPVE